MVAHSKTLIMGLKYRRKYMLQEATRAINSAFNNSFIKKISQYLHDCIREEVKVLLLET